MQKFESTVYSAFLFFVILLTVLLQLPHLLSERLWPDEALYAWYAQQISSNAGFILSKECVYPPVTFAVLSCGNRLWAPEISYRAVELIYFISGIYLIYYLGSVVSGRYLGILAATLLAFNPVYFNYGTYILLDNPMAIYHLIFAIGLIKLRAKHQKQSLGVLSVIGLIIVLSKLSGALIIPWLLMFFYFLLKEDAAYQVRVMGISLGCIILGLALFLFKNFLSNAPIIPSTSALHGKIFIENQWYYLRNFDSLIPRVFIPFFFLGFFVVLKKGGRVRAVLLMWLSVYLSAISLVPEKDFRYALPVIPCLVLMAGMGMEAAGSLLTRTLLKQHYQIMLRITGLMIVFAVMGNAQQRLAPQMNRADLEYTGYAEAAQLIRSFSQKDLLIVASSPRAIKYYCGEGCGRQGGNIVYLPRQQDEFEAVVDHLRTRAVLLQIDGWTMNRARWIYPLNRQQLGYLEKRGFRPVKVIYKPFVKAGQREQRMPVIVLFYRAPGRPERELEGDNVQHAQN